MAQLSLEEVKKISPKILLKLIHRAKNSLKKNDVFKEMCKEYNVDTNFIDLVPVRFGDIDVSAKTDHGVIILNYKLLCDGDFLNNIHYLVHEYDHVLIQCLGDAAAPGADDGDYLHNPVEQKGFQRQIQFIDDLHGEEEAENYTENLLNHHDKDGKERDKLKEKLMEKVD
jgi:hypothetical protein